MARQPRMDEQGLQFFKNSLAQSQCYLEYGCGGSTVYACNEAKVRNVISVDTSWGWVAQIREEANSVDANLYLEHIDVGEVGDWGRPKGTDRYRDFWKYTVAPWKKAAELKLVPDTVLIDGRFRVACFLYSLLAARQGTTLIFDDYFDRPNYFVVEKYCRLEQRVGRVGIFKTSQNFNTADLVAEYARYTLDWS
jgi:hypothetical protein